MNTYEFLSDFFTSIILGSFIICIIGSFIFVAVACICHLYYESGWNEICEYLCNICTKCWRCCRRRHYLNYTMITEETAIQ